MKRRIHEIIIGDALRYVVQTKWHWWEKWHYLMDGNQPRLFTKEELHKFNLIPK